MAPNLREQLPDYELSRAQAALGTTFDFRSEVRKRRTVGYLTKRGTWVRIEVRDIHRVPSQGWNGHEAASRLDGVAMPQWLRAVTWNDYTNRLAWRADEMSRVTDRTIQRNGFLTTEPDLSDNWWSVFGVSLDALAASKTTRIATPGLQPITQERVTETIHGVFPDVDTQVTEWCPAHGDLSWPNLTGPRCTLLDWEDWGMAPRGWDAATLWADSLLLPELAARVEHERRADLLSPTGRIARLFKCASLISASPAYSGPLLEPAQAAAAQLLAEDQATMSV